MKMTIAALLLLVPVASAASKILVGGVALEIPHPIGFVPITQQMTPLYEFQKAFVPPTSEQLIAFIPDTTQSAAPAGTIRMCTVAIAKEFKNRSMSSTDFMNLKGIVKSETETVMQHVDKKVPGLIRKITKELAEQHDVHLALSFSKMVPLAVHEDTDRTIAYSYFGKYNVNDESGTSRTWVGVGTGTFVHVMGKILFLYSMSEESGLEWSRETSRQWASSIVAANPADSRTSADDSLTFWRPTSIDSLALRQMQLSHSSVQSAELGLRVLAPTGWIVRHTSQGGDHGLTISRELSDGFPRYRVGFKASTVNALRRAKEVPASTMARDLCAMRFSAADSVSDCSTSYFEGFLRVEWRASIAATDEDPQDSVAWIAYLADDSRDTLIYMIFVSPSSEWEQQYPAAELLMNGLKRCCVTDE